MTGLWAVFKHAAMISVFVFVMMLLVDFFNVLTSGRMTTALRGRQWQQYLVGSFLGATPGCLGAFMNVSFYVHGLLSFGAIVGGMIATSGDEAFVMLALFPGKALLLFAMLFAMGIVFAFIADKIVPILRIIPSQGCGLQQIHTIETCECFDKDRLAENFLRISLHRGILLIVTITFLIALTGGFIGPPTWDWQRVTLAALIGLAAVLLGSASNHYIREHVWGHIFRKHIWRVFLWSFFAILVVDLGLKAWDLEAFIKAHMVWVLLIAVLVGIIPESGPHLIFVMMFSQGLIPFSVLLAASFVQDGHGMLPLLAYSVKDSLQIKAFNLVFGLLIGLIFYAVGW